MIKIASICFPSSLILLLVIYLSACGNSSAQFYGKWVNPNKTTEIMELRRDGTFISSNGKDQLIGVWNVYKDGHITLSIQSEKDRNIHVARLDPETDQLIITIAGDHVVMRRAQKN